MGHGPSGIVLLESETMLISRRRDNVQDIFHPEPRFTADTDSQFGDLKAVQCEYPLGARVHTVIMLSPGFLEMICPR
jgi:hypothetical protein